MPDSEHIVAAVIKAAGGEIVGRVRLQKEFYLLEQLGLNTGFTYSYHHYGPYSADLVDAVDGAKAFRFVTENVKHRRSDGVPFSVYAAGADAPEVLGDADELAFDAAQKALHLMQAQSATVLELAATIHWLNVKEGLDEWRGELVRRKGMKTEGGRTEDAVRLLKELGLNVP